MSILAHHRIAVVITALALGQTPAHAYGPNGEPESVDEMRSVLTSTAWQLRVEDAPTSYCREVYYYHHDGSATVLSADERIEAELEISQLPGDAGFVMHEVYTDVNGLPDCQGDTYARIGGDRYMRFVPLADGTFRTCWSLSESSCFGWIEPFEELIG